jgi:hypothetical protein
MRLESVRKVRASFLEDSLQDCTVGTGCKRPPAEEHTRLPDGGFDRLAEEGSRCRLGMELEVDRSQQCRVAEVCSHGHIHQVYTAHCILRRGLDLS